MNRVFRMVAVFAFIAAASMVATSCGGGGGDNGGAAGNAVVLTITVQGVGAPIFTNGQPTQPVCPVGSFLNSTVSITFGGPVDIATLPPNGAAAGGSIQIVDQNTAAPAVGVFSIDPATPNVVRFTAQPPVDPAAGCTAGFVPGSTYGVFVPDSTQQSTTVIRIGGIPLTTAVTACFTVVGCPGGTPFVDSNPGPPMVVSTTPPTSPAAPVVTQAQIQGNPGQSVISIDINEALDPVTVSGTTVAIVNTTANALVDLQSAGQVLFQQFGTIPGFETISRITFTTFAPLVDGDVFEITFVGVADLGGNLLTSPPGTLLFTVADNNDDLTVTFMDDFTGTSNLGSLVDSIEWPGDGAIRGTFPVDVVGNGLDGAFVVTTPLTINTDNQMTAGDPNAIAGVFNYTSVDIQSNIVYRSTTDAQPGESNHPVRIRSIGSVDIVPPSGSVVINCVGRRGQDSLQVTAIGNSRFGGHGGPGAGSGGIASPNLTGASPAGLPGEGGHVDFNDPTLPGGEINLNPASPFFGGGGGGAAGQAATFNDGPGGGAGGIASSFMGYGPSDPPLFTFQTATAGESHTGSNGMGAGAPAAGQVASIPPAAMIPPLMDVVGGSGGGAGGDRVVNPAVPSTQNPGAGGGGGGGAIRITSAQKITIGDGTLFRCEGGDGGSGVGFFIGGGAGGSGGSVIVQTFSQVNVGLGVDFRCAGGIGNGGVTKSGTLNGEGGNGGGGVAQIEDLDGATPMELQMQAVFVEGEYFSQSFALSGAIPGTANSIIIDTLSNSVDYTMASATVDPGTVATATVDVLLLGIAEDPANPGQPSTTTMSSAGFPLMMGPVALTSVSDLNGFRYFRFQVITSFPAPPLSSVSDTLPSASDISVTYITNM